MYIPSNFFQHDKHFLHVGSADFYRIQMIRGKPVIPEPGSPFTVREVGNFVFVTGPGGILLEWDGGTRVYVKLSTNHQGKVMIIQCCLYFVAIKSCIILWKT